MPKKVEEIKIHMNPNIVEEAKNRNGQLGQICNNCGGYGFTMNIKGGKLDCLACNKTGVKVLTLSELQAQVNLLRNDLTLLKKALLETLQTHQLEIETNPEEAVNV